MARNIITLKSKEALSFFMKSEQYHGFELPEYFDFDEVLKHVETTIKNKSYEDCLASVCPDDLPNVNLDILLNCLWTTDICSSRTSRTVTVASIHNPLNGQWLAKELHMRMMKT